MTGTVSRVLTHVVSLCVGPPNALDGETSRGDVAMRLRQLKSLRRDSELPRWIGAEKCGIRHTAARHMSPIG